MKITKNTFLQVSYHYKTILTRNPLNYYSLKVTKFHGDSVKNESAREKKLQQWRQTKQAGC